MTEDHQASSNSVVSTNATEYAVNFNFPNLRRQTKYSEIAVLFHLCFIRGSIGNKITMLLVRLPLTLTIDNGCNQR